MKRLDLVFSNKLGVCLVADLVAERDGAIAILAAAVGGTLRFTIGNEGDLVPIEVPPELDRLRQLLRGMPALPLPGEDEAPAKARR